MKERPILFSASMVRAILEGRKTQTRRVLKAHDGLNPEWSSERGMAEFYNADELCGTQRCRYGVPGDRLWVREAFSGPWAWRDIPPAGWGWDGDSVPIWYWADGNPEEGDWTRPKPSIHMPRRFSRITLEITDVRVQRVQDITAEDALAEGVSTAGPFVVHHFMDLWNSINAKRGFGWDANPWVWALTFKRIEQEPLA